MINGTHQQHSLQVDRVAGKHFQATHNAQKPKKNALATEQEYLGHETPISTGVRGRPDNVTKIARAERGNQWHANIFVGFVFFVCAELKSSSKSSYRCLLEGRRGQ